MAISVWYIREETRDFGLREFYYAGDKQDLIDGLEFHCRSRVGDPEDEIQASISILDHSVLASASRIDEGGEKWQMEFIAHEVTALKPFRKFTPQDYADSDTVSV